MDWLKIQKATPTKPEIVRIAAMLGVTVDDAFGKAFRFWAWWDDNTLDGHIAVTVETINMVVAPGLGEALLACGWLEQSDKGLYCPNWERHMSQSAKDRALRAIRMGSYRAKKADANGKEKPKRKKPEPESIELPFESEAFKSAWAAWQAYKREGKKPLTPSTARLQLAKLAKMGEPIAVAAIRKSIEAGWQGLFPPDKEEKAAEEPRKVYSGD